MKKDHYLKILTTVSIVLAICVVGLLLATTISTTVRAEEVVEAIDKANSQKSLRSRDTYIFDDSVFENNGEARDPNSYTDEDLDNLAGEYYGEIMEYYGAETEAYYEETTEYYEEATTEYYEEITTEYYEEPTTEYYEEPTTEYYEEPTTEYYEDTTTEYYEEPTTEYSGPEPSPTAAYAAAVAMAHVGVTKYVPACHTLTEADCSGFTHACYEAAGYPWLSYSDSGQACEGRSVLYEEWLPGDILCFPGHVGMYVGDGMMVHCPDIGRYAEYDYINMGTLFDVRRIVE